MDKKDQGMDTVQGNCNDYCIHACKAPAGYVFANKLEQPLSYNAIMKSNGNNPFIQATKIDSITGLGDFLKKNGYYMTDGSRIVLCGTQGELWDVKPDKLIASYTMQDGSRINLTDKGSDWFVVRRAAEAVPSSLGIQLPKRFLGVYQTSWATLMVNDPNSKGHGEGDILVAPKLPNGQPDYANISPTNNAVFALTYNLNVGGWARSGCIVPVGSITTININSLPKLRDTI